MKKHEFAVERFVQYYLLTEEEIALFKDKYSSSIKILQAIAYYREGDKEIYKRPYIKGRNWLNTNSGD